MAYTYELNGDSYITVSTADAYHSDRNRSEWSSLSQSEKEAALRRATAYLDQGYKYKGQINDTDNSHAWPRTNVEDGEGRDIDSTTIPQRIKDATAELAYIDAVEAELLPTDEGGETQAVKAGSVEIEYSHGQGTGTSLTRIDRLIKGLAINATGTGVIRS